MAVIEAGPLINPSYEPLGKLTRSLHWDDFVESLENEALKPAVKVYSSLSPNIKTTLQGVKLIARQKWHAAQYTNVFFVTYVLYEFFFISSKLEK